MKLARAAIACTFASEVHNLSKDTRISKELAPLVFERAERRA